MKLANTFNNQSQATQKRASFGRLFPILKTKNLDMNICPACEEKIGFAGLEPSGRYVGNKKWYQLAEKEMRCPHCKIVLAEVNTRPLSGRFGISVLLLATIAFAIFGTQGVFRLPIIFAFILGFLLLAYYIRGFRVSSRNES